MKSRGTIMVLPLLIAVPALAPPQIPFRVSVYSSLSRSTRLSLLTSDPEGEETYDWSNTTAFEGNKVNLLRQKQRQPRSLPDAATMFSRFRERPGTFILIFLFLILTVGDFAFNVSRQFICVFQDLCAPASV